MAHQSPNSSTASKQNTATDPQTPSVRVADQDAVSRAEPQGYVASDYRDASLAAPAAGEMVDYGDEGEPLDADVQQGSTNANRPARTEVRFGQGPKTTKANRQRLQGED